MSCAPTTTENDNLHDKGLRRFAADLGVTMVDDAPDSQTYPTTEELTAAAIRSTERLDAAASLSVALAIETGHVAPTGITTGTIITDHVNIGFGQRPEKVVAIVHPNGEIGLYERRDVACGIESTRILTPDRLKHVTIDPKDAPVDVRAERMSHPNSYDTLRMETDA